MTEEAKEAKGLVLDYNDQCDLVYGRLRRLAETSPEVLKASDGAKLLELGLEVKGLGVTGAQVDMVFQVVKVEESLRSFYEANEPRNEPQQEGWALRLLREAVAEFEVDLRGGYPMPLTEAIVQGAEESGTDSARKARIVLHAQQLGLVKS